MTVLIILTFSFILIVGLITLSRRQRQFLTKHNFAIEYREKFIELATKYFANYNRWNNQGDLDSNLYMWLTKNVNRIQGDLGYLGTMHYVAPFQIYQVKNYQIIINTIPKFRVGQIENFDITSVDDCLIRYIGVLEEAIKSIRKKLKKPIMWFQEGFQEILSLPLYVFSWFGILSDNTVAKVTTNNIFKIFAGICGLITFASGIVTIIQGKEQTVAFIKQLFHK